MPNDAFKALSDPTRRQILEMLAKKGELSAGEITARFEMSAPSVSHHLALLRAADLVLDTRQRQRIYYRLNAPALERTRSWLDRLLEKNQANTQQADANGAILK